MSRDSFRSKDHVQDFFRTRKALNVEGSIEGLLPFYETSLGIRRKVR